MRAAIRALRCHPPGGRPAALPCQFCRAVLPRLLCLAALLSLLCLVAPARADETITVRSGNHPGFGRVVFDAPRGVTYRVLHDGDTLTVQFPADATLQSAPHPPHNVTALQAGGTAASLTLLPGSTYRVVRLGAHVVVDVFDPAADEKTSPGRTDSAAGGPASTASPRTGRRAEPAPRGGEQRAGPSPAQADAGQTPPPAQQAVDVVSAALARRLPMPPPVPASPPAAVMRIGGVARPVSAARPALVPETGPPDSQPGPAAGEPRPAEPATRAAWRRDFSGPAAPDGSRPRDGVEPAGARDPAEPLLASAAPRSMASPPGMTDASALGQATPGVTDASAANATRASDSSMPIASPSGAATASAASGTGASDSANGDGGPVALIATAVPLPPDTRGVAFQVPLAATTGAAVFERRGETLIVFDERRPIDMSGLAADPALGGARVVLLPAGTLIRMTPPPGTAVSLTKTAQGWIVSALSAPPQPAAITADLADDLLHIAAASPGRVLTVADPETGDPLLVGTQLQPGQAVLTPQHAPQFALLRTRQGVVVAPLADAVALHAVPDGFALTASPDALAVSQSGVDVLGDAAALTRRFAFSTLPPDRLLRQLSADIAAAATEPVLARGPRRRQAAVIMLSLGMGAEAEALLQLTAADDPRQAESADVTGLTAVAALMAGRLAEAGGIDDPRLTGTDEITLWRALHSAMRDETSRFAATALAGTAALLLTYPPPIRDRMLPIAAETMVQGGALAAAKELLARAGTAPGLDLARAMLAQATGDTTTALTIYDRLAAGHDQLLHARAAVRAVELRLAIHQYDTRQAAEALDRLLYAWRGDQRELNLREKLAALRQQLGEWREALTLLRDSEALFPADAKAIHAKLQATFDALLDGDAADTMPAIDFVALVNENADLVPNTAAGMAMQAKLADRLVQLDLPRQAGPVLDKLMRAAPVGAIRATYGARLAALRLREDDANGAMAALRASEAEDLPAPLAEQRVLLRADAQARVGDVADAVGALSGLDSVAADAERASIYERAKDWPGAEQALARYAAKAVPPDGALTDTARRVLLRLATAAARAGDQAALSSLRAADEKRIGSGPLGEMFRLLTADTVRGAGDLDQVGRDIGYARALPGDLQAMQPAGTATP